MIFAIVDTNVFLRFITKDVPHQAKRVKQRFQEAQAGKLKLLVLHTTIIETLFHLEHWYKFPKSEAIEKLILLLSPEWLEIEDKVIVIEALTTYKISNIDLVDLLVWSTAKKQNFQILSFDKHYDKLIPKLRLEP